MSNKNGILLGSIIIFAIIAFYGGSFVARSQKATPQEIVSPVPTEIETQSPTIIISPQPSASEIPDDVEFEDNPERMDDDNPGESNRR